MEMNKGTHSYCYPMSGMFRLFAAVFGHCKLEMMKPTLLENITLHLKNDFHDFHAWQRPYKRQTDDECQYTLTFTIMPRAYLLKVRNGRLLDALTAANQYARQPEKLTSQRV